MSKLHIRFLTAAIILSGSSTLAQSRNLTEQERLQMQKELAWEKQQKLKADRDAATTYTERCHIVAGRLANCQGSQPANKPQGKPVAVQQTRTPAPVLESKAGKAYGNLPVTDQSGYQYYGSHKPNNFPKSSQPDVSIGQKYRQ